MAASFEWSRGTPRQTDGSLPIAGGLKTQTSIAIASGDSANGDDPPSAHERRPFGVRRRLRVSVEPIDVAVDVFIEAGAR